MGLRIRYDAGKNFKEIALSVDQHEGDIKSKIKKLGDETVAKMKDIIDSNKVRPQAGEPKTLEDQITVQHFPEGGWGVGDIQRLDASANYWRAVNFGSAHMVGKFIQAGEFAPGEPAPNPANNREGRWKAGQGSHIFLVKNPIPAMNFIEKTANFLKQRLNSIKIKRS